MYTYYGGKSALALAVVGEGTLRVHRQ